MNYLYWLRRDLRVCDNQCLSLLPKAVHRLDIIYPWPQDFNLWSEARQTFLMESLTDLNESLQNLGQKIWILEPQIEVWLENTHAVYQGLTFSKSFNSREKTQEQAVLKYFQGSEKHVLWVDQGTLYSEDELPIDWSHFPKTFSAFRRKIEKNLHKEWSSQQVVQDLPPPQKLELPDWATFTNSLVETRAHPQFKGGESFALQRLQHYLFGTHKITTYKETRNGLLEFDDSSKFSPWLALGCLSPRTIMTEIKVFESQVISNESTYWLFFELLWRDYFKFLAQYQGDCFFQLEGLQNKGFEFPDDEHNKTAFRRWTRGETGQPFIDANMRELLQTGWMSNRGRQNVASYLAKIMKVNWTWGAQWFETNLIDSDPESNWGNWAYLAGVSVDPRDRVFNPERQAEMYDPQNEYQNKFAPKDGAG